jgi:hypothetical protein
VSIPDAKNQAPMPVHFIGCVPLCTTAADRRSDRCSYQIEFVATLLVPAVPELRDPLLACRDRFHHPAAVSSQAAGCGGLLIFADCAMNRPAL